MKSVLYLSIALSFILFSCRNGNSEMIEKVAGEWKLQQFINKNGENKTTDCDKETVWNFTKNEAEALTDGTNVMEIVATAPDNCKWFGFDAKWTIKDDKLFISTTNVGGMGGNSNAGLFELTIVTDTDMTLKIMGNQYVFSK